jgi:hypothetical protein
MTEHREGPRTTGMSGDRFALESRWLSSTALASRHSDERRPAYFDAASKL